MLPFNNISQYIKTNFYRRTGYDPTETYVYYIAHSNHISMLKVLWKVITLSNVKIFVLVGSSPVQSMYIRCCPSITLHSTLKVFFTGQLVNIPSRPMYITLQTVITFQYWKSLWKVITIIKCKDMWVSGITTSSKMLYHKRAGLMFEKRLVQNYCLYYSKVADTIVLC